MKKIVVDCRAYRWAGIGRYIRNLIVQFSDMQLPCHIRFMVPAADVDDARRLAGGNDAMDIHRIHDSHYSAAEQVRVRLQLLAQRADLYHFPHFNVPVGFSRPYIVTIHDTTRFFFPGQHRQSQGVQVAYEWAFSRAVAGAVSVIAVSHTTARDMERVLTHAVPARVIYEGVSHSPAAGDAGAVLEKLNIRKPYVLFVGVWMSHKNMKRIVEAFARIALQVPDHSLVLTGDDIGQKDAIVALARRHGIADKVCATGFVDAGDLPHVFANASCLLFPSLYEGFGLPALEAAAYGVPVVTSNVSSLPEIIEQCASYVNPEHADDIANGVMRVLKDQQFRERLIDCGTHRARLFSWEQCAKQTLETYMQAM